MRTTYKKIFARVASLNKTINSWYSNNQFRQELIIQKKIEVFKLHSIYDIAEIGLAITNEYGKIIYCNKFSEKLLGITTLEQFKCTHAGPLWNIIGIDGKTMQADEYASTRAVKEGTIVRDVVMGIVKSPNEITWVSVNASPINMAGFGVVITYIDITDKTNMNLAMNLKEQQLSFITDNIPVVMNHINREFKFIYANKYYASLIGKNIQDIIGKELVEIIGTEKFDKVIPDLEKIFKGEKAKLIQRFNENTPNEKTVQLTLIPEIVNDKIDGFYTFGIDITELQQAQKALKEREFEINHDQQIAGLGSWTFDPITLQAKWSNEMYNILGIDKSLELIDYAFHKTFIHPDDFYIFVRVIKEAIELGKPFVSEIRCVCPNRRKCTIVATGETIIDQNGKVVLLKGTIRDITEKRKMQDELKESELRFKNMFVKHNSIMLLVNPETLNIIDANMAASNFYGYSVAELTKMNVDKINSLPRSELIEAMFIASSENKNCFQFMHKLASGKLRYVEVHTSPISYSGDKILFSIIHDITARKEVELALLESNEKYKMIFNSVSDSILILDFNGKILSANTGATTEYGYTNSEFIALSIHDIDAPEHNMYTDTRIADVIQLGTLSIESIHLRKDKSKFYSSINCQKIVYNNMDAILCLCRNINKIKTAEIFIAEQNKELQKLNNEKDKFFSIIAHDLKSPFNSVLSLSDLLHDSIKEKNYEEIKEYVDLIVKSTNKATSLLKNLMDWSRSQTGRIIFNPMSIDLSALIIETTTFYKEIAEQKSITIITKLPDTIFVLADKDMISTVLRNLISNAIKFTNVCGKISVIAEKKEHEIVVKIKDNGVGIPPVGILKLFQISNKYSTPGTQNEQGTGLGLILCKDFIDKHEGKIWVESEVGIGSSFNFALPIV